MCRIFRDFAGLDLDRFYNDLAAAPINNFYRMNDINDKVIALTTIFLYYWIHMRH